MTLRTITDVALLVSLFPMAVLSAQARQIGGVGLTVFEDPGFRGRSATLREDTRDFKPIGLNDLISSLRVGRNEQWEVCENANYRGLRRRLRLGTGSGSQWVEQHHLLRATRVRWRRGCASHIGATRSRDVFADGFRRRLASTRLGRARPAACRIQRSRDEPARSPRRDVADLRRAELSGMRRREQLLVRSRRTANDAASLFGAPLESGRPHHRECSTRAVP
jgi:hypothetical protein